MSRMMHEVLAAAAIGISAAMSRRSARAFEGPIPFWMSALQSKSSGDRSRIYQEIGAYFKVYGNQEQSELYLREAIRLNPKLSPAIDNLAWILFDTGRREEAIATIRRCVELQPEYGMGWQGLGAMCEMAAGQTLDEAGPWYEKAIELDSRLHRAWNRLGLWHARRKNAERAMECFVRARAMAPNIIEYTSNLGMLLLAVGRKEEAEPLLSQLPQPIKITSESLTPQEMGLA